MRCTIGLPSAHTRTAFTRSSGHDSSQQSGGDGQRRVCGIARRRLLDGHRGSRGVPALRPVPRRRPSRRGRTSGIRDDAPEPTGDVTNTDGGDVDRLTLLAVNDVADFWEQNYSPSLDGTFKAIERLQSYDSEDPSSPAVCGTETYDEPNAFYCPSRKIMAWDRGVMVPTGRDFFGEVSIAALMAHEYGHAVQHMAGLVDDDTTTIVSEQQADCFAGTYIRWVAEGQSPRFSLSTGDGLNHVLAAAITLRDPILGPQDTEMLEEGHGTALDRVSAFQMGFVGGASECAKIDLDEIEERRGDLPMALPLDATGDVQSGEVPIDRGHRGHADGGARRGVQAERGADVGVRHPAMSGCPAQSAGVVLPRLQHDLRRSARVSEAGRGRQRVQLRSAAG